MNFIGEENNYKVLRLLKYNSKDNWNGSQAYSQLL